MTNVVRSGPLTQAQRRGFVRLYWRGHGGAGHPWSVVWTLPAGISIEDARRTLVELVERHEILRTAFAFGPDGLPCQLVFDAADFRIPVAVADVSGFEEYIRYRPSDLIGTSGFASHLWSIRLFADGTEVRQAVLVFEHIITDGSGLKNWELQFVALARKEDVPRPTIQPLDRQAREYAAAERVRQTGQRRPNPIIGMPQVLLPSRPDSCPPDRRYLVSSFEYDRLLDVVARISADHAVSPSMVLMYVIGVLFCTYAGHPRFLYSSYLSNRPGTEYGVECQINKVDLPFEYVAGESFRDGLHRVRAATLQAYTDEIRFGALTPEERAQVAAQRGVSRLFPVIFNFQGTPPEAPIDVGPIEVKTTFADRYEPAGTPDLNFIWLTVEDGKFVIDFDVDAAMLPAHVIHRIGTLVPDFCHLIASDANAGSDLVNGLLPADFAMSVGPSTLDGNWIDIDAVDRALSGCHGVREARAELTEGRLVAHLSLHDDATPFDVHEQLMTRLSDDQRLVAPSSYLIMHGTSEIAWQPARDLPVLHPSTTAEHDLVDALCESHGITVDSLAMTYVAVGGTIIQAPALAEALGRRGYTGLRPDHFTSAYSLRAIARALVPMRRAPRPS